MRAELDYLKTGFNSMLIRIESLTHDLEARVREATEDLARKNVELQTANEQLSRVQIEMARAERFAALGQLAGEIAHELGTPLNSVLGYVQLLQNDSVLQDQGTKLAVIESQVRRMIDTIRSVLDRTRDVPVARHPVAVEALVNEALGLVTGRLAAQQLLLKKEFPPESQRIAADPISLRQVLVNLLTNAIDATPPHGTITVSAAALPAADGQHPRLLDLSVSDTGHGLSADEIRLMFEPFYTTKAPGRGSGLGMAIVDYIVRAHGGKIVVDSRPTAGTTVHVQLPLEE
jgi:signal transduction histidine kinase